MAYATDFNRGTPLAGTLVTHSLMGFAHKADMHRGTPFMGTLVFATLGVASSLPELIAL
ncbi:MAG: hypothetical protein J6I71_03640 [Campylobacter sp.]|uniref:hypothetical protein n=1 Tax=Campylobacter sp. TaxID=205 RepID=UPI001B5E9557|nr:hypothetical protein [Campylobacter sp.]MBP3675543.1 hypothetical protein [Campylobacter sp.]